MLTYDHIFDAPENSKPISKNDEGKLHTVKPEPINIVKQVQSLGYQLAKYDKRNIGKTQISADSAYIEGEMQRARLKQSWNKMDKCFQWQFVQEYLDTVPGISVSDKEKIMKMFKSEKLADIVYNTKLKKIDKLNLTFQDLSL